MPWREDFDTFIGENAFRRDFAHKKEEIEVSPDNKVFSCYEGALLNHLEGRLIYCPKNKVSFSIPETVQIIGKYAMSNCSKLKKNRDTHLRLCHRRRCVFQLSFTEAFGYS
jgi:hypothetical protein